MFIDKKLCEKCMKEKCIGIKTCKFEGFLISKMIDSYYFNLAFKINGSMPWFCYIDVENSEEIAKEIMNKYCTDNRTFSNVFIDEKNPYFDIVDKKMKTRKSICKYYDYYLLKNSTINKDSGADKIKSN